MNGYPHAPAEGRTDTSREAAEAMAPLTARVQRAAFFAISEAGAQGLTAHELADRLGMEKSTTQPRISELRRQGRVMDSGERRANANGKRAIVWIAKPASRATTGSGGAKPEPSTVSMTSGVIPLSEGYAVEFKFRNLRFDAVWSPSLPSSEVGKGLLPAYRRERDTFLAKLSAKLGFAVAVMDL